MKKLIALSLGIVLACAPLAACKKKDAPAPEPAPAATEPQNNAADTPKTDEPKADAPSGDAPDPKKPEAAQDAGKPALDDTPENRANILFDESNPNFDFSKGCEELRKLDQYESAEMLYRRAWCDHIQALTVDEAVKEQTVARLKEAGAKGYPQALFFLADSGIDTSGLSYMWLIENLKERIKTDDTPETQYMLAEALMKLPPDVPKESMDLFEKSAKANYLPAIAKLGYLLMMSEDSKEKARGKELLEKAISLGSSDATLEFVSNYDFEVREGKDAKTKHENAAKLLDYCEKSAGIILTCRSEIDVILDQDIDTALRDRAHKALPGCIASITQREGCDLLQKDVQKPGVQALPLEFRRNLHDSLIKCYKNVIRHGDERHAIVGKLQPTNQEVIDELKTNFPQ